MDLSAISEVVYLLNIVDGTHGQIDSQSILITQSIFELLKFCLVKLFLSLNRAFLQEG